MGCASSKRRSRCRKCRGGLSPVVVPRSYSMHVHHPAQHTGDSSHMVALTSSTIGSLSSCDSPFRNIRKHLEESSHKRLFSDDRFQDKGLEAKLIEAKGWSSMIDERIPKVIPKTPSLTPPGEPEMINTWELMEGLEDVSPLRSPNHLRSFSFDVVRVQSCNDDDFTNRLKSRFVKSLKKEKVILYFTSLRGIRKTYEDSCNVRIILKSLGVRIDERDVSMHSGFRDELKKLLKDEFKNGVGISLPRVFLGDKYIGGVDEIKKFNENGTLGKVIEGCEKVEDGLKGCGIECEACGDVRFVPCETCSGSCKIYYEGEEEEEEDVEGETDYGFQRCPDCNENGLIRCPLCCE